MQRRVLLAAFAALFVAATLSLIGAAPAIAASEIQKAFVGGVAIDGTDPVAYFREGRAVEGSSKFSFRWKDAEWRFKNAANRDAFKADPEAFAPQFGGYCAWAVSQGYTAATDPQAWTIDGGKLYLNYSLGVRNRWNGDRAGNIAKGHKNWPKVLGE